MKALDNRNATARKKALEGDPPQPYGQLYIDSSMACPHCDQRLRRRHNAKWGEMDNECDCSFWRYEMYPTTFWKRVPKSPDHD